MSPQGRIIREIKRRLKHEDWVREGESPAYQFVYTCGNVFLKCDRTSFHIRVYVGDQLIMSQGEWPNEGGFVLRAVKKWERKINNANRKKRLEDATIALFGDAA